MNFLLENFLELDQEHIRNSIPYRIYENDSPDGPLSNRDSGTAEINSNFENFDFEF